MIYFELNFTDFIDEFKRFDRMQGWSVDGLRALFDYLEERSEE